MFGMGWGEMVVIGVVALIVVGPQELPGLFRTVGNYVGKAKGMAREFSRAMDQAADQAGMKDLQRTLNAAANPTKYGTDLVKSQLTPPASDPMPEVADEAAADIADADEAQTPEAKA